MKTCKDCKKEKPKKDFYIRSNGIVVPYCKVCHIKISGLWAKNNIEANREKARKWWRKNNLVDKKGKPIK